VLVIINLSDKRPGKGPKNLVYKEGNSYLTAVCLAFVATKDKAADLRQKFLNNNTASKPVIGCKNTTPIFLQNRA
jgi:hypothetical protein